MPKITYVDHAGTARTIDGEVGSPVMETAIRNNVPGIDAECARGLHLPQHQQRVLGRNPRRLGALADVDHRFVLR